MSPRKTHEQDRTRFTLWLTQEALDKMEVARRSLDKGSVAEVIRDAIEVYLSLLQARERDVELFFESKKTGKSGRIWLLPGPPPV
jgi:NTP pyrophosphatase (non-canonical NTP hydrolase)